MVDVVSSLSLLGFLRRGDLTVWNKKNFPRVQTSKGDHNICGVGTKKCSGAKSKKWEPMRLMILIDEVEKSMPNLEDC